MMYAILGAATAVKILLWLYCVALQHKSDSVMALAEDHRNDILSNATAIACGIGASSSRKVWWIDPAGAILISCYIIWSWMLICKSQVRFMIVLVWDGVTRGMQPLQLRSLSLAKLGAQPALIAITATRLPAMTWSQCASGNL